MNIGRQLARPGQSLPVGNGELRREALASCDNEGESALCGEG